VNAAFSIGEHDTHMMFERAPEFGVISDDHQARTA
jgi:hypothetical protein